MKSKTIIIGLILIFILGINLSACNPVDTTENITITGVISFEDSPLPNVEILINNQSLAPQKYSDDNGRFSIDNLKKDDEVSFKLESFVFNNHIVTASNDSLIIIATKERVSISLIYDDSMGIVESCQGDNLQSCTVGAKLKFIATPYENYSFIGYYCGDKLLSTECELSFTVEKALTITVVFEAFKHQLLISNVPENAVVSGCGSYCVGETVCLIAQDTDGYAFLNWVINGVEIFESTYSFKFSKDIEVSANFIKRLSCPNLKVENKVLLWDSVASAVSYDVYVDNSFLCNTVNNNINIYNHIFLNGQYKFSVVAVDSNSLANSVKSEIMVDYIHPLDTPKNFGFLFEVDEVFVYFNKVNGATCYNLFINNMLYNVADLPNKQYPNSIGVNITALLTENINYSICLTACGVSILEDSLPTDTIVYSNSLQISPPCVEIYGDTLKWSHPNTNAKFNLIINQLRISLDDYNGSINLAEIVDCGSYDIIIEAYVEGYQGNSVKIVYTKAK